MEDQHNYLKGLHFVGKDRFYIDKTPQEEAKEAEVDQLIDRYLTKKALSADNFNMELPRITPEERERLRSELLLETAKREMVKRGYMTEEELEEMDAEIKSQVQEAINQHREHITNDFKIVK